MINMNVGKIQIENSLNLILGFGFNKQLLNLNNSFVKHSQFCKGIE
jgi:hypothetical protein